MNKDQVFIDIKSSFNKLHGSEITIDSSCLNQLRSLATHN